MSKSASSDITDRLAHAYEAFRTRDLSGYDIASMFIDTVYEPLRRWGSKTGVLCVWGICVDGRKVLLSLSTAHSESYDSCLEVLRDLVQRGLQTPVTITTDGAPGLSKAIAGTSEATISGGTITQNIGDGIRVGGGTGRSGRSTAVIGLDGAALLELSLNGGAGLMVVDDGFGSEARIDSRHIVFSGNAGGATGGNVIDVAPGP